MTTWFNLIGWRARQLEGGYKTYRRWVLNTLETLPSQYEYIVLTGHTGTGKTRLLHALAQAGAQTLDLEHLSCHRGSLLGAVPGQPQPSQKSFESSLVSAMSGFDASLPIFIEAESRRIGSLDVPKSLLDSFHGGVCVDVTATHCDRIRFLLEDYSHLFERPEYFKQQLARLMGLHSKKTIERWHALIDANARAQLFAELIAEHYDPAYVRSSYRHFHRLPAALTFKFEPNADNAVEQALELLRQLNLKTRLILAR
jgi:tRNA 2-selenouridine synthase